MPALRVLTTMDPLVVDVPAPDKMETDPPVLDCEIPPTTDTSPPSPEVVPCVLLQPQKHRHRQSHCGCFPAVTEEAPPLVEA